VCSIPARSPVLIDSVEIRDGRELQETTGKRAISCHSAPAAGCYVRQKGDLELTSDVSTEFEAFSSTNRMTFLQRSTWAAARLMKILQEEERLYQPAVESFRLWPSQHSGAPARKMTSGAFIARAKSATASYVCRTVTLERTVAVRKRIAAGKPVKNGAVSLAKTARAVGGIRKQNLRRPDRTSPKIGVTGERKSFEDRRRAGR
jgi:hypothetical protein